MSTQPSILYLSKSDISQLGGDSSDLYVTAVSRALELHAKGDFVQPLKPYLPTGSSRCRLMSAAKRLSPG